MPDSTPAPAPSTSGLFSPIYVTVGLAAVLLVSAFALRTAPADQGTIVEQPAVDLPATAAEDNTDFRDSANLDTIWGTPEKPINLAVIPSTEGTDLPIAVQARRMVDFLEDETNMQFELNLVQTDSAAIQGIQSRDVHIAFLGPKGYARAYEVGGRIRLVTVRYGFDYYYAMIVARADSGIESIADCEGLRFGYRDRNSTSGYVFPRMLFDARGVSLGDEVATGGHPNTVREVYEGDSIDIGAAYWSPPRLLTTDPELAPLLDLAGFQPQSNGDVVLESGYRATWDGRLLDPEGRPVTNATVELQDAREDIVSEFPDVFERVKIVELTAPIPNDGIVVHSMVPDRVSDLIVNAFLTYAETEEGQRVLQDMYKINEFKRTTDAAYAGFRALVRGR